MSRGPVAGSCSFGEEESREKREGEGGDVVLGRRVEVGGDADLAEGGKTFLLGRRGRT